MKPEDIIENIVEEGNLKDKNVNTVVQWIVENEGKETLEKYISAVEDDYFGTIVVPPRRKNQKELSFKQLKHSHFFDRLAFSYSNRGWHEESEQLFKKILERTPNDIGVIHDYGAMLANWTVALYRQRKGIDKSKIEKARNYIFKAYNFDKKYQKNWRNLPAYKNLAYIRAIEATYYLDIGDRFTAFVLGWISIEMTLYRIWYQFMKKQNLGKTKIENLMRWNIESIIETLYFSEKITKFNEEKNNLDTLRGLRNNLIHGDLEEPTSGNTRQCINTAVKLIPILQG